VVHGELRGQKRFSFKPPLVTPTIMQLCRVMALGHIEYGDMERSLHQRPKASVLVTEEDLLGLEMSGFTSKIRMPPPGNIHECQALS
jgi:hypothetical protein